MLKLCAGHTLPDVLVESTNHYRHWEPGDATAKSRQQRRFVETLLSSKFALCPCGDSDSSIRLYEAMELGCAPVVLGDRWTPIDGLDWSFCLFVRESQLGRLDSIIRSHADEWSQRGAAARRTFEDNFSVATLGALMERQTRRLLETRNETREQIIRMVYPAHFAFTQGGRAARRAPRDLVLGGYRVLGRRFPCELNR